MRVLIGGVGYPDLRDHSAGPILVERLASRPWPDDVCVEDVSYNPIAVVQRLQDEPPGARFDRAVLVSAVERPGRAPGVVEAYRWDGALPDAEHIQDAVAQAVTGVILLDNTLVVARHFGALPPETAVVEVQPEMHEFGMEPGPAVARALERMAEMVTALAILPGAFERLPVQPLGAGRLGRG